MKFRVHFIIVRCNPTSAHIMSHCAITLYGSRSGAIFITDIKPFARYGIVPAVCYDIAQRLCSF